MPKKNTRRQTGRPTKPPKTEKLEKPSNPAEPATATSPCPCGLGKPYAECCGPIHAGAPALTAELLMRSRYTAYAIKDIPYLTETWHPATRPTTIDLDDDLRWTRLEIIATTGGGPFHTDGTVEFDAHYTESGRPGILHENSAFVRLDGRWLYTTPVGDPLRK